MVNDILYDIPRPEELIRKARERDANGDPVKLNQRELLALKSRSFAIPIAQLKYCRGAKEEDKELEITILYNSLRKLDCIEDGGLTLDKKLEGIDRLTHVFIELDRQEADLEGLINTDLRNLTTEIVSGAVDEEERVFIEQFGYGETLRKLHGFKSSIRNTIINCVDRMGSGMKDFLRKGKIETMDEFNKYRFYVAEIVGETLNRLVYIKDGVSTLESPQAREVGGVLQGVNIVKNLNEDHKQGANRIKFIPDELHVGISSDELFDKDDERVKEARKLILDCISSDIKASFGTCIDYVIKIPGHLSGYTAFVLTPLITAEKTLELMEQAGADRVFRGDKSALKIGNDVFVNISRFTGDIVRLDDGIRIRDWAVKYKYDPKRFSFKPGEYEIWSPQWLTDQYLNGARE